MNDYVLFLTDVSFILQTPLHLAVITQQYLVVRALMGAGANVNLPDRNGQTALHLACQRSDLQCIQELLRAQNPEIADCEAGNFDGFKPLHLAVFVGSVEIINCLVENGADINCKVSNETVMSKQI